MINLIGIAESAKVLMGPTILFIVGIFAIIVAGFFEPHPVAVIGDDLGPIHATEALGLIVILKAFSAGCSSLTGVEAIANAVPSFRSPSVKRAQHTEIALGFLLGAMLLGLVQTGSSLPPATSPCWHSDPRAHSAPDGFSTSSICR